MFTPDARQALQDGYLSREDQLVCQREATLSAADGAPLRCQLLELPNRLSATVCWDRCMDISRLAFAGLPLHYQGKPGEAAEGTAFDKRFVGGMLYTCGLTNVGTGDTQQPTHGRIHLQSADYRCVCREGNALVLRGQMRESALFGENLLLRRSLTFPLDRAEVRLQDEIVNQSPRPQPWMLLYHINLGYPFLSGHLRLLLPPGTITIPVNDAAAMHLSEHAAFAPPQSDFAEQDYHHTVPSERGFCTVRAENPMLGLGFQLCWRADSLPLLVQWRCLRSGDYVLGLEPANNHVNGRYAAQAEGNLPVLQPFETIATEVTLSFYPLAPDSLP